jgi:GNAT superfamily N-acetyltransferase
MKGLQYDPAALERTAKRFRREIWHTPPPDAISECGIEVQSFGPLQATLIVELSDIQNVNVIFGAAEPGGVEGGHLADAIEWADAREVDYCIPVTLGRPETGAAEDWLNRSRYEQTEGWMKFVRDASPPDIPEMPSIEILQLEPDEGEGMSSIAAAGLGLPDWAGTLFFDLPSRKGWRCYVALLNGELAACGSMMVHEGIAELGIDVTRPQARGRGCQLALLRHRIAVAAGIGCHTLFAEVGCTPDTTRTIASNLEYAGFEQAYESRSWRVPRSLAIY